MKNRILLLLVLVTITVFAQDLKLSEDFIVDIGEEYLKTTGGIKEYHTYEKHVIKLANNGSNLVIQRLDPETLGEVDRIEKTDFFKDQTKGRLERVERLGDNLLLLYRLWDKKTKTTFFNIRTVALSSLKISDFQTVVSEKGKISGSAIFYKTSFNQNKLLIAYKLESEKNKDSKNIDRFSINVFDENLSALWNKDINMPYTRTTSVDLDLSIDNEGNVYFLTWVFKDEKTKKWMYKIGKSKKKVPFLNLDKRVELLKLNEETNEFIKNEVKIDDYFISNSKIVQVPQDGVMVVGTLGKSFRDKKKVDLLFPIGFFTAKFTNKNVVEEINNYDFSDSILNKYKEDRRVSKKESSKYGSYFNDFAITDVVFNDDDGSLLLFGEQFWMSSPRNISSPSIGYTHTSISFKLNDIFIAKILADGTLSWSHRLPKHQRVDNRGASEMSFKYFNLNNHHYLFYQDHIANLDRPDDEAPSPLWDLTTGYLMAYVVDNSTGSVKKEAVFNLVNVNNGKKLKNFITDNVLNISKSKILIEGYAGDGKDFLVKVTAKK